jgi:hypothetical protein
MHSWTLTRFEVRQGVSCLVDGKLQGNVPFGLDDETAKPPPNGPRPWVHEHPGDGLPSSSLSHGQLDPPGIAFSGHYCNVEMPDLASAWRGDEVLHPVTDSIPLTTPAEVRRQEHPLRHHPRKRRACLRFCPKRHKRPQNAEEDDPSWHIEEGSMFCFIIRVTAPHAAPRHRARAGALEGAPGR